MKPIATIKKDTTCDIWDNLDIVMRVYRDLTIITYPYTRWLNNSGSLTYGRLTLRGADHISVLQDMAAYDDCGDEYDDNLISQDIWDNLR